MQQQGDKTHPQDGLPERCSVDDVDCYLRVHIGLPDGDALFEQQQQFERGRLVLHWRRIDGPDLGQEGDIPSTEWGPQLRLARDHNSNTQHGPVDFATAKVTARNDGRVFVQQLTASVPRGILELTVLARAVRMVRWPAPREPTEQEEEAQDEETPLVTAIKARIAAEHHPGKNEQWKRFCDKVRDDAGVKESDRGCSDRSIRRIVENLPNK